MRLDLLREFDEQAQKAARPIYRIPEKSAVGESGAPESLIRLARVNNFQGEMGVVLAGEEGVLLGVGDRSDPFIAAAGAERLPEADYFFAGSMSPREAESAAFAWLLGGYRFDRYKKQKQATARLIAPAGLDVISVLRAADATGLVRDLVNTPAADMAPAKLEEEARQIGARFGADVECIIGDELLHRNFPMIHAVGRAALAAPRLIDLVWGRSDAPKLTLVGKGVSFDSGGLNLKPASGMLIMKKDMGGAATALGLAQMIMDAGVNVRLRVLIPAVENAVSGASFRPGDILKSRKGPTVEIGNTDAEGRLILADALAYAGEEKPALLVSLATLTGAARVALGPDLPPFFSDDEALAADIAEAAAATNDPVWRLPLWQAYDSMLSTPIADVNNSPSGGFAGAVTAALFLKRFVPADVSWAHFDIFAWRPKAAPGRPLGGEAQAMRALDRVVAKRFGRSAARP